MRIRAVLSASAAVLATALLAGGASASGSPVAAVGVGASAKIFRPVGFHQVDQAPAAPAASSVNLLYNGGKVFTKPGAFIIYWGPEWGTGWTTGGFSSAQAQTYVNSFFGGVGGSTWLNSLKQYCQGVATGSQFCPAGSQFVTNPGSQLLGTWNDTTSVPSSPTDTQVRAAAQRGAAHFGYNPNALYLVYTPHNKSISGFGTQFCAYHDNTSFNGQPLAYANMPYVPDAGTSCGRNFVNGSNNSFGNGFFDGLSIVSGHEYAEAASDAFPSNTIAWLDNAGAENGDKCAWGTGPGPQSASTNITLGSHFFAVQSLWSNLANGQTGGCVISS
jgi:serine protease